MGRKKEGELSVPQYVKFKCDILKQMAIEQPPEEDIKRLSNCSYIAVDNYFRSLMCPKVI